ncbi:toprim domain-containing protein [Fibrella sp. WM1]|uniref:toprim domain-containing protein n=1 Tax=Fibrella musci TaxID=3242485 RepID=UPI003520700A
MFEVFFDLLSCCQQFKTIRLRNPTIVLNSLSFLQEVVPTLTTYRQVNVFFDNDTSGKRALGHLQTESIAASDCSVYYPACKDYNEYHIRHHLG